MISKVKKVLGRSRAVLKVRLRSGTPFERSVYYSLFSDAFRRERNVVSRGHQEYSRREKVGTQEFLLRRNIHMLEKGLTMQPRRATFALDYIGPTVELFRKLLAHKPAPISTGVENWARDVLVQYFDATRASGNSVIAQARDEFDRFTWETDTEGTSVPHAPSTQVPPVGIDALTTLAERRKSVRWFLPDDVPRDVIDRAMLVARESPSACNRQPFTFRVFDDPAMVKAVAAIPMGTAGYAQNLKGIVVIVGELSAFIDERDRHLIYTDGCLAAMSFILGLEAQGVASVCINWPDIVERDRRMASLLNLESHQRVVMLVGYGYADPDGLTPFSAKRRLTDLRSFNSL
ncbi:nitroreductase family protein [Cryobacterium sp. 1639]|uniref:nitroreductase family protein n=1 Tax=Cryobacterium inferilacus TaxID=2866629 RepID=UPI001C7301D0|nr:nitroreductase family protein [Cryobacterium sp. 1639]MBX0301728.1 nitroreductase family protein [Cryobacterium sp. 1639]